MTTQIATELDQLAEERTTTFLDRRDRTAQLRTELAAARAAGKRARHATRLRREAARQNLVDPTHTTQED